MRGHPQISTGQARRGFVLISVLVVVLLLTLAAYQFSELMLSEYKAADSYTRAAQARALADSGVHYAAATLSSSAAFTSTLNGNPFDNSQAFQGILVNPQALPRFQGRFSIISPLYPDDANAASQPYRFGAIDESGKMNLNSLMTLDSSGTIAHDMLMTLPNMTEDIANSILDWIDPDDEPRPNGAESDYYSAQSPPYRAKNGPLDSIEELLFVKGVTPQLLLGNDQNRNGVLDPEEDDGSGTIDRGWSAYLTVYSREQNVDSQGNPRVYVNDPDMASLNDKLTAAVGQDLAKFIVAYRTYGPAAASSDMPAPGGQSRSAANAGGNAGGNRGGAPAAGSNSGSGPVPGATGQTPGAGGSRAGGGPSLSPPLLANQNSQGGQARRISSLYELINTQVSIPASTPQAPPTLLPSPLNDPGSQRQLLPQLLDEVTTVNTPELPARINVNTAPQTVLMALPGLTASDAQNILAHRPSPTSTDAADPIFQTPAWLLTEANISAGTLRSLERYITARTQIYRVQVVGYFDGGGPSARIEAVIDTNQGNPRIIYYRDLTELGRGFNLAGMSSGNPGQ